jgi:hypothetical protein
LISGAASSESLETDAPALKATHPVLRIGLEIASAKTSCQTWKIVSNDCQANDLAEAKLKDFSKARQGILLEPNWRELQ